MDSESESSVMDLVSSADEEWGSGNDGSVMVRCWICDGLMRRRLRLNEQVTMLNSSPNILLNMDER